MAFAGGDEAERACRLAGGDVVGLDLSAVGGDDHAATGDDRRRSGQAIQPTVGELLADRAFVVERHEAEMAGFDAVVFDEGDLIHHGGDGHANAAGRMAEIIHAGAFHFGERNRVEHGLIAGRVDAGFLAIDGWRNGEGLGELEVAHDCAGF